MADPDLPASPPPPGADLPALRARIEELERRLATHAEALAGAAGALAEEMRRREEALAALAQLEKLEILGELTGGIAHDIRNTLQPILLGFELLERSHPGAQPVIERGRRAAHRVRALVQDLLGFARHEEARPVPLDLAALVEEVRPLVLQAAGSRTTCTFDVEPGAWPVLGEPHRLESALLNLALNARDAMAEGGRLTLEVTNRAGIRPSPVLPEGDYVSLAMQDSGAGMTPEVLARATEPFFTTKAAGHGTGLGLAMVRRCAEESGGGLRIESAAGRGTRVEILLPRVAAAPVPPASPPRPPLLSRGEGVVLLVDSDELGRPVTASCLRDHGFAVLEAASAAVAEPLAAALPELSLLVCDLGSPGLDGPGLAHRLRERWPDLPALFIGGADAPRALDPGHAALPKPFGLSQLLLEVERLLSRN